MRVLSWLAILFVLVSAGCAGRKRSAADQPRTRVQLPGGYVLTPANTMVGRVIRTNKEGRFVVLTFPIGVMPAIDQRLFVYRDGLKVGEVKVTGPQRDDNTVADVVSGVATIGDEVREQ